VRVIAATNPDVRDLIGQKQFREDLYYRLATVELKTPALAGRREDLPLRENSQVRHSLLQRYSRDYAPGADRPGAAFLAGNHPCARSERRQQGEHHWAPIPTLSGSHLTSMNKDCWPTHWSALTAIIRP
jgi:sigma54-dependent transcription regulator